MDEPQKMISSQEGLPLDRKVDEPFCSEGRCGYKDFLLFVYKFPQIS